MRLLLTLVVGLCLSPPVNAAAPPPVEQWIVVVASNYGKAVAPLVEHRRAQGLRVVVVPVRDVLTVEGLAFGDAAALRDHVRKLWQGHPGRSSILLVGTPYGPSGGVVPAPKGT